MDRRNVLNIIEDSGIIAVIRLNDPSKLKEVISALSSGGITALEITMTTPSALELIRDVSHTTTSDFIIGVGSVLDAETARMAILAGAHFIVGPVLNIDVIKMAHRYDKVAIPGAFTPTEILSAWESGADVVKVFPATVGGPKYFRDILGPLPQVKLTPTGGVTLENAAEFIKVGAFCLGVGTALLDKKLIAAGDWAGIAQKAKDFKAEVESGRVR